MGVTASDLHSDLHSDLLDSGLGSGLDSDFDVDPSGPREPLSRDELLEEWDWLRGEVPFWDFGRRMRINQAAWERAYQRARAAGDPRAVRARSETAAPRPAPVRGDGGRRRGAGCGCCPPGGQTDPPLEATG